MAVGPGERHAQFVGAGGKRVDLFAPRSTSPDAWARPRRRVPVRPGLQQIERARRLDRSAGAPECSACPCAAGYFRRSARSSSPPFRLIAYRARRSRRAAAALACAVGGSAAWCAAARRRRGQRRRAPARGDGRRLRRLRRGRRGVAASRGLRHGIARAVGFGAVPAMLSDVRRRRGIVVHPRFVVEEQHRGERDPEHECGY